MPLLNTEGFNKSHNWPARPVILKWNAVELPESNHPSLHEKWKESQKKEEGRGKEGSIWLVNLWKLMTVSNFGACTQAWQVRWVVFKIVGFVCKHFLPFFPIPPHSFTHPTFVSSLMLIPSSLHGNCMEVLATQANWGLSVLGFFFLVSFGSKPSLMSLLGSDDWTEMSCKTHLTTLFWLIVKFSLGLVWSGPTVLAGPSCSKDGYYHPQDNSPFSGYVY